MIPILLAAAATLPTATDRRPCEERNLKTQSDMNACASREFELADADMNAQWRELVKTMKAHDADIDPKLDKQPGYMATLLEAQRAWLKYRDAHCLLVSFDARGGTTQPMLQSQCMAQETEVRTQQLRELTAGPEYEG